MINSINLIENWRKCFNLPIHKQFTLPSKMDFEAHCKHITEESNELLKAFKECNREEILDGTGDLFWVTVSLNMLLGIPAHKFVEKGYFYGVRIPFDDLDEEYVENSIKIIHSCLEGVKRAYNTPEKEYILPTDKELNLEAMLWSLNRYVIHLINYLQVDLDKIISIIYESNMSKLCDYIVAGNSIVELGKKGIVVKAHLSPMVKDLPRYIGEHPKKYYLAEENSRIRKPLSFSEPKWELY